MIVPSKFRRSSPPSVSGRLQKTYPRVGDTRHFGDTLDDTNHHGLPNNFFSKPVSQPHLG